jgi:hypothetical protein
VGVLAVIGSLPHTCTIQRRYPKQKLSYVSGTVAFHSGATVTEATSGATAVIDRVVGTAATGYLILKAVTGTFVGSKTLTDNGSAPVGTATSSGTASDYKNDSNELEYYWTNDQTGVICRFYTMKSRVTVLTPGQFPGLSPYVILPGTVTIAPLTYRILSTTAGYTPTSGLYGILGLKAPYNRMTVDHYTAELKELASA